MAKLTAQERREYEAWAKKELVKPFLEAMTKWKGKVKANPYASAGAIARKPIPCHPVAICLGPLPGGPNYNQSVPGRKKLKVKVDFEIGP